MKDWHKKVRISNDAIIDGKDLWLVSNYTNVLMKYDIDEGNLKQIYYFPEKFTNMYSTISYVKVQEKIYFAPYNGEHFWCFHIPTEKFERIDLGLKNIEKKIRKKFRIIIHYKCELILIGFELHSIFRISIDSNVVKRCDKYLIELENRGIAIEDAFLGFGYQLVGEVLYLPMLNHNIIIAFNLEDDFFKINDIYNLDSNGFDSIEYYQGKFRLITSGNEEVIWNYGCSLKSKIKLNLIEDRERNYWRTFQYNDVFIYFPLFDSIIYVRNEEGKIEILPFLYPEAEFFSNASKYEFIKENNEKIYFQVRSNGNCYYIDLEQLLIRPVKLKSPDDDMYRRIVEKAFDTINDEIVYESEIVNVMNPVYFLKNYQKKETGKSKKCGEIIYRNLK